MSGQEEGNDAVNQSDEELPIPRVSKEETGVEPIIMPEKRPLLYTDTKKKAGRGGRRVQTEPEEPEGIIPNEDAAPVKARAKPAQKSKKDGRIQRAEDDSEEGSDEESDEPSQVLEGIIYLLEGLWNVILSGFHSFISFICSTCRILPWMSGIACYLLTVYLAGYYVAEPHTRKEFPDIGSRLVVAFRMSVWLYLPLFLGMLLKAQPPQSGGQQFYQSTLMTINMCLLVTQIDAVNMHWIEVMARTLSMFEVVRLVSELMKLNTLMDILGMVPKFLIPSLYAYNLYYIVCEDFTFCDPPKYTLQDPPPQDTSNQGWSVCSVVENLCGSPVITTVGEL